MIRLSYLLLFLCFNQLLFATNPNGDLRLEVISAYNFVVDSNDPESGPTSAYVGVNICNDGTNDLSNVIINIGDFTAGTPGVYPTNTVSYTRYAGTFSFEHSGGCDGTDGTRSIGIIPAGECVTEYWLLEYPVVDGSGDPTIGGNSIDDDLTLDFDYWATADDGGSALAANDTWTVALRSMISAMANKASPNGTNKVPNEYLDAIEGELGWRPDIESASAGEEFELQGIWYDLGRVNKGYDNDGDFIPDYNVFMQPVGDPSKFDPCCFRLTKTYGIIIVKKTDGTEHLIPFENQLYFPNLPEDNNGVVGLVFYEFLPLSAPCSASLTPYQNVASGSNNEKYNGDFGASFETPSITPPNLTFNKSAPLMSSGPPPVNLSYDLSVTNNEAESVGLPQFFMPLVISDAIPAGTVYVAGSATLTGPPSATVHYSTDNGISWSTTEPATASDVTNIQWWLDNVLDAGATATATFDVNIPITYTDPVVENEGAVGFGNDDPFTTDDASTIILGTNTIGDIVFSDDGGTTGTTGNGTQDGDEVGLADIELTLYLDTNSDGIIDANDIPLSTVTTDASGNYSFPNLPDGDYIVIIDDADTDLPVGWGITTDGPQVAVTISGGDNLDVDFGFVPAVEVSKTLTSPEPAYENQYVTYDIQVSNLIGGGSAPVLTNPYPSDIWSTTTGVYQGGASGTSVTSIANATGAPDGVDAVVTSWIKDGGPGWPISHSVGNSFSTHTFDQACPFSNINTITGIINFELTGDLSDDDLGIYINVNNVSQINQLLTIADLNANYSPATSAYTFDITPYISSYSDLASLEIGVFTEQIGGGSAWDGIDLHLDAIGISITADPCIVTPPTCSPGDLTLDFVFDTYSQEVSWDIQDESSTVVASSGGLYAAGLTTISESITLVDGNYTFNVYDSANDGLCCAFGNGSFSLKNSDGTVLHSDSEYLSISSASLCIGTAAFSATSLYPVPLEDTFNPAQMCFVESSMTPDSINNTTGEIFWNNIGPINGGEYETVSVTFEAKVPTTPGETLDNTATVTGATYANGNPTNDDSDIASTTLQPTGSIGDLITNSNTGLGIEGITVNLTSDIDLIIDGVLYTAGSPITTTTDANGNYLFDGLLDANYTVIVDPSSLPGTVTQTTDPDATFDNSTDITIASSNDDLTADFAYQVPNAILGSIWEDMDADGMLDGGDNNLAGITVELTGPGCAPCIAITDADGNYSFGNLADGTFEINVLSTTGDLSSGAWSNTVDPDADSDSNSGAITLSGGQISSANDFGYNETGSSIIGNTLFVDWDGDGVQDATTDEGISGVTIYLYEDANGDGIIDPATDALVATQTTAADGVYSFDNLPAGDYTIVVDATTLPGSVASQTADPDETGGACTICNGTASVTGVDGTTVYNDEDFGYAPFGTGQIGDNVFVDSNGDGIQDPTETGLVNIDVILYADLDGDGNYTPVDTVTTDTNGNYLFENLPDGNYQVLIDPAETDVPQDPYGNDAITTAPSTQDVVISGGDLTEINGTACTDCNLDVDFGYAYPASIGNAIFYDNNANGTQDFSEGGIVGVTVYLCAVDAVTCNASTAVATQVTDANGEYLFTGLDPGEYNVVVDATTLPGGVVPSADPNSDGVACSDPALITFGYDACDNMADSVYVNYGAQMTGIDFGYEPTSVIGDQVWFDVNGDGIVDAGEPTMSYVDVIITPPAGVDLGNGAGVALVITTDSEGLWSYANLPDGSYTIELDMTTVPVGYTAGYDADGGDDSSTAFTMSGGSIVETDDLGLDFAVELSGSNAISGSVCLDDGTDDGICSTGGEAMLAGTTVYLYNDEGTFMGSTNVGSDGSYTFTGLPDDTYNVVVGTNSTPLSLTAPTTDATDTPASSVTDTGTSFYQTVTVSGGDIAGLDFAFQINQDIDFGDLPGPYPTALTDGPIGAYHILVDPASVFLGAIVDAETSPTRNLTASGDDADGVNDDDGIVFNNTAAWTTGVDGGSIDLTLGGTNTEGFIVAYIDFNEDGDFSDPGEMIMDTLLANGTHSALTFDIPAGTDLSAGNTFYSRFRVFEDAPAFTQFAYSGEATNGEVEDYRIVIDQILNTTLAIDDDNITMTNVSVDGDVMTNDTDPQGDNLTFSGFDNPADPGNYITSGTVSTMPATDSDGNPVVDAGDLTVNPDGTYTFLPATDFEGTVEIPYLVCDDGTPEACENATLTITVNPIPNPDDPTTNSIIANNDDNVTYEDVNVNGNVLTNDADPDGDNLSFSGFEDPANLGTYVNTGTLADIGGLDENGLPVTNAGDLIINTDGSYTFDPEPGFTGTVTMPYEVCDDATPSNCTIAQLQITVLPDSNPADNNPPFAGDDFSTTNQDTPVDGNWLSNDNDSNSDNLTVNGSAANVDPDAPGDGSVTLATLTTEQGGTVEIFNDGTYTYTPLAGYAGPDEVSYEVCDVTVTNPQPLCDSATIHLLVTPVNTIGSTDDFNNTPFQTPVSADVSTNDFDEEGHNQTFTLDTPNGGMNPAEGTVVLRDDGSYTFTPATGFSGTTAFQYEVCDDGLLVLCDTATVYIEVFPAVNPESTIVIANPDVNTVLINQTGTGNVMSNDLDPDDLKPSVTTTLVLEPVMGIDEDGNTVAAGTLSLDANGIYSFTPAAGFTGVVTQSYTICNSDAPAVCDNSELIINVLPETDNTTFANDDAVVTDAGVMISNDVSTNDRDIEMDDQSITDFLVDTDGDGKGDTAGTVGTPTTVGGTNDMGVFVANAGSITLNDDGTYTFTPAAGFVGNVSVPYTTCDDVTPTAACEDATLVITVLDVKRDYGDAPSNYPVAWHRAMTDATAPVNELDGATDVWLGLFTDFETSQLADGAADGDLHDDAISFGTDTGDFPLSAIPGQSYDVYIEVNSKTADNVFYGVWIDWGNDGNYDNTAFYTGVQATSSPANAVVSITAPASVGSVVNIRLRADDQPFVFDDYQGGRTNGEVEDHQATVSLPVELTMFRGEVLACNTRLTWTSETEENFSHYELERSEDGQVYQAIETIHGSGGTTISQTYQYEDEATNAENYYRLKMVDLDGTFEYSGIVYLETECDEEYDISLYPNPVSLYGGTVDIKFFAKHLETELTIIDVSGIIVNKISVGTQKEWNTVRLDISHLSPGTYFVRLSNSNKTATIIIAE